MLDNDDIIASSSSPNTAPANTFFQNGLIQNTNSSLFTFKKPTSPTTLSSQSNNEKSIFELSKPFNSFHNSNKSVAISCSINNNNNNIIKNTNYFSSIQNNDLIFKFNEPTELNSQLKLKYNNRFKNNNGNQRNHIVLVEQSPFSVFKSVKSQENIEVILLIICIKL
jgi:hypothetical protein